MKRSSFLTAILLLSFLALFSGQLAAQGARRNGEVTKIDAGAKSFMLKTARGETNVVTTEATVIKEGEKTLKFADLKVGDHVSVAGERKGNDVEAKEVLKGGAPEAGHEHPM